MVAVPVGVWSWSPVWRFWASGVFPILKTLGYAACSRVSAYVRSYSIGVSYPIVE